MRSTKSCRADRTPLSADVSQVTNRQIRLLGPYLEGDHPTHTNTDQESGVVTREWNLVCPLHDDNKRSASINIDKGLFFCFVCGGMPVTKLITRKAEWYPPRSGGGSARPNLNGHAPDTRTRHLHKGLTDAWHANLLSNEGMLQWLEERKGITIRTVKEWGIGINGEGHYTIPVKDLNDELVNVRYYNPRPSDEFRKIMNERGYGSPPRLYPIQIFKLDPEKIIICEGEWDTLLAIQNGYAAVTRTSAADVWDPSWGDYFVGRTVYLIHDMDRKGQSANIKIEKLLRNVADKTRIIKLPYEVTEKHGKDLSDFLLDNDPTDLKVLLDEPVQASEITDTITVLDSFDAKRVGKPVNVLVTIKGRREPGYSIPRKVHLVCTQDAGNKCQACPMRAANGSAEVEIEPDDPIILNMIEYSSTTVGQVIAESYGVPGGKCGRLHSEVEEHRPVEILYARPSLDHSDGTKAGDYKNITITHSSGHDTPANETIIATGALQPNPKTQSNEFLAHHIEAVETSVDYFDLNSKTISLLKRFQAARNPISKLASINKNLAEHVTRIHGRPQMHALMDLTFHSVLSFNFAGEQVNRGWLESLIVGDTRTGKSLAAERLVRHYGGGEIISCEAASFAGVVGGVQQLGAHKNWAVTWGVVPINDRRLVVLDEISGLQPEEIAQMSDIRSSGQARLIKVVQETTWARTRLLWLGNPRNATMANYTYGVDAVKPLIGNAEDIARFDLAMAVSLYDVASEVINQPVTGGELRYTDEACHNLLLWVWTRQPENIRWAPGSEKRVFDAANAIGKLYIEDPPLVQAANVRIKIARIAVAIAARLFSTDKKYERVIVTKQHVDAAVWFMNMLYEMPAFGYRERSKERIADREQAESRRDDVWQYLLGRPTLHKFLRGTGQFRRQDLEEILNISRDEANGIINALYESRMVRKVKGDIVIEPTLHTLLREGG